MPSLTLLSSTTSIGFLYTKLEQIHAIQHCLTITIICWLFFVSRSYNAVKNLGEKLALLKTNRFSRLLSLATLYIEIRKFNSIKSLLCNVFFFRNNWEQGGEANSIKFVYS
ncbi:hypothetical protein L150_03760 [Candida albicans Ca529L]|nr:hypothetical protein MEO_03762 [Candida albicans P94015]KGQ92569.1 hypothetical protein MG1_03826 [Candida albicans GC75]KGU26743.1 hypothetical protein MGM_03831 [Candida albicans P75063]KHC36881.1 hypothetical protein W5O_03847 [Candida albicans Ca6]KHC66567.1 hypothetical protein MGI_03772 [Candida albicans P75016]RLP64995.1 hypothetical protein L150_03760 [Candida albicans Ca529L]